MEWAGRRLSKGDRETVPHSQGLKGNLPHIHTGQVTKPQGLMMGKRKERCPPITPTFSWRPITRLPYGRPCRRIPGTLAFYSVAARKVKQFAGPGGITSTPPYMPGHRGRG